MKLEALLTPAAERTTAAALVRLRSPRGGNREARPTPAQPGRARRGCAPPSHSAARRRWAPQPRPQGFWAAVTAAFVLGGVVVARGGGGWGTVIGAAASYAALVGTGDQPNAARGGAESLRDATLVALGAWVAGTFGAKASAVNGYAASSRPSLRRSCSCGPSAVASARTARTSTLATRGKTAASRTTARYRWAMARIGLLCWGCGGAGGGDVRPTREGGEQRARRHRGNARALSPRARCVVDAAGSSPA